MKPSTWAPRAATVELMTPTACTAMKPGASGWFFADMDLHDGDRYGFSLDGGPMRPDPRSRRQPDGVHEMSQWFDVTRFEWGDQLWEDFDLSTAILYELHIGTFSETGTFDGAIAHLDHLAEVGINAVEVMPIASFPGTHGWGYDGVDLFCVHEPYGGPAGFARFVDACHQRGLGVVLDVVYNHFGPAGSYLQEFGPYLTDHHNTPWGNAVNLDDDGSDEVRSFFVDNARMWLRDFHVDGLRLDAVHALVDDSEKHFLAELADAVVGLTATTNRSAWLIAESDLNDPRVVLPIDRGGLGIHAQWSDDFHHALHVALTGERTGYYERFTGLRDLVDSFDRVFVRAPSAPVPDELSGSQFVVYGQNHDQIGNRAQGDRLPDDAKALAIGIVVFSPHIPMLFQGEEWGATTPFCYFTDHTDQQLANAVTVGRTQEFALFGWRPADVADPQDKATFIASKLKWDEAMHPGHADSLKFVRDMIALRRGAPELCNGDRTSCRATCDEDQGVLWVTRAPYSLVANFSHHERLVQSLGELAVSSQPLKMLDEGPSIPPRTVAIFRA